MQRFFLLGLIAVSLQANVAWAQPVAQADAAQDASGSPAATYETALASELGRPGGLTAIQAAERALKASPELRAKTAELLQAQSRAAVAKLSNVPYLAVGASYTRLSDVEDPQFGPGISFEIPNHSASLSATLTLPITDYLFKNPRYIRAGKQGLEAAQFGQTVSRSGIVFAAQSAYYEWVRITLQVVVAAQLVAQLEQTLRQLRAQADVERLAKAEVLTFEAEMARAELALAQVRSLAEIREAQLRIQIGASPSEVLLIGERLGDEAVDGEDALASDASALTARAMAARADVAGMTRTIAAQETLHKAHKADMLPKLALFGQASYDNPNQRIFPMQDKFTSAWAVGARLTWSVNDLLFTLPKLDDSQAALSALRAKQELLAQGVSLEVLSAKKQLELALASLATAQRGVAAAEEGARVRGALFDAGRATSLELIGAQTQLTRARADAINARIDIRIASAQFQRALGDAPTGVQP
ncbi:MAG: TolC family protein [Myxococcales bacterium]|nr:TolC family protein [Myxococcales bacterium]